MNDPFRAILNKNNTTEDKSVLPPVQQVEPNQTEAQIPVDEVQQESQEPGEDRSYLPPDENKNPRYFTQEQVEKLSNIPISILHALEEDPTRWQYIESLDALHKIEDLSVLGIKQRRFVPGGSNIGVMMMRKDDGSQVIDRFVPFTFFRDQKNRIAWAIFITPKPKTKALTKLPGIGKMGFLYDRIERIFNTEVAIPSVMGYLSAFDAGSLEQTPLTNDKNLIPLFHKLDRELNQTIQGLILANTEAERLKKRGTFWEKYGVNIMMFLAIMMLAIAIYMNGTNIAGLKTSITSLGSQISSLGSVLPKGLGGLPPT